MYRHRMPDIMHPRLVASLFFTMDSSQVAEDGKDLSGLVISQGISRSCNKEGGIIPMRAWQFSPSLHIGSERVAQPGTYRDQASFKEFTGANHKQAFRQVYVCQCE
jgi:hypothetical protein